jgi:hypothetical protein
LVWIVCRVHPIIYHEKRNSDRNDNERFCMVERQDVWRLSPVRASEQGRLDAGRLATEGISAQSISRLTTCALCSCTKPGAYFPSRSSGEIITLHSSTPRVSLPSISLPNLRRRSISTCPSNCCIVRLDSRNTQRSSLFSPAELSF